MTQEFECKEPGCNEKVVYKYIPVEAVVRMTLDESEVVYLTCEEGHTYPYEVKVSK